jgi:chemotaxis protein methyltransferase CheR
MLKNYTQTTHSIIEENVAQSIKEIILNEFSIELNQFDNFVFRRRLSIALSFLKILPENIIAHTQKLDKEKIDILMHFLYPGENELFRDTETWIFLRDKILKELINNNKTKFLFYNTTTGEDFYSLLIILNEFFPNNNVEITIASPSEYSLNKIIDGTLAQPKNRSSYFNLKTVLSNNDISKYLHLYNNRLSFNKVFIKNISYKLQSFGQPLNIEEFDLIMCRNKTLPFNIENISVFIKEIISKIKPKGFLVIGINENLPKEFSTMLSIVSKNEKIFIKKPNDK